jgi:hypothetical protein
LRVLIAAVTFLPSGYLATIGRIHIQIHRLTGGIYEIVEMGAGAMIYIPILIKIGSGIQKLMGGGDSQRHRQHGDLISLLLIFKIKEMLSLKLPGGTEQITE